MSTLYRPTPITSAEQAEALPEGTVATHGGTDGYAYEVAIRDDEGLWWSAPGGLGQDEPAYTSETIVGFAALVPIEVEEHEEAEYGTLSDRYDPPDVMPAKGWQALTPADRLYRRTIYRTLWEEAGA